MNKTVIKNSLSVIIVVAVIGILIALLVFSGNVYFSDKTKLNNLDNEVEKLQTKVRLIDSNKNLVKDNIDEYNKILSQLIPDTEDFFSIIYALENLSNRTGFIITGYVVNVTSTKGDKFSLTIQGDGDANAFLDFLKKYNFSGGRFITNGKIEFSPDEVGKIKLALNFYNKKVSANMDSLKQITASEIDYMNNIKNKVSINLKMPENGGIVSYTTKTDPFAPINSQVAPVVTPTVVPSASPSSVLVTPTK